MILPIRIERAGWWLESRFRQTAWRGMLWYTLRLSDDRTKLKQRVRTLERQLAQREDDVDAMVSMFPGDEMVLVSVATLNAISRL